MWPPSSETERERERERGREREREGGMPVYTMVKSLSSHTYLEIKSTAEGK
jgi:hypothetical protein